MHLKNIVAIAFALLAILPPLSAQEDWLKVTNLKIGGELGGALFAGEELQLNRVRRNSSAYYYSSDNDYNYSNTYTPFETSLYAGVKAEMLFVRNRIGVTTGFRITRTTSSLNAYYDSFLWLLDEQDLNTSYVRVKSITQHNSYVGIPLEARFFFNDHEMPMQSYVKLGAQLNYRLSTNNEVLLVNSDMNRYAGRVARQMPHSDFFNAYIFPAFGFKIGNERVLWVNVEVQVPLLLIHSSSSFLRVESGIGLSLSVLLPYGKNNPIGWRAPQDSKVELLPAENL